MTLAIRVAICDEHPIVRNGSEALLSAHSDLFVVAKLATGSEAIELARADGFDVLLLEISFSDGSGITTLSSIVALNHKPKVLMLTSLPETEYALTVLRLGAMGFVSKASEPLDIVRAIRLAAAGRRYVTPAVGDLLAGSLGRSTKPLSELLSQREMQTFLYLAAGLRISDVAEKLQLSVKTVSTFRTRIIEKTGLESNAAMTHFAVKTRLIS